MHVAQGRHVQKAYPQLLSEGKPITLKDALLLQVLESLSIHHL
ncbi:MAG: hypothetical protein QXI39_01010 [Candidatus Bathyarchaeia archaeon]